MHHVLQLRHYDTANPLDPRNDELTGVARRPVGLGHRHHLPDPYAYNTAGQLTSVTTPADQRLPVGRTTSYTYSDRSRHGRLRASGGHCPGRAAAVGDDAGRARTSYGYYSDGDLAQVTEPAGPVHGLHLRRARPGADQHRYTTDFTTRG